MIQLIYSNAQERPSKYTTEQKSYPGPHFIALGSEQMIHNQLLQYSGTPPPVTKFPPQIENTCRAAPVLPTPPHP